MNKFLVAKFSLFGVAVVFLLLQYAEKIFAWLSIIPIAAILGVFAAEFFLHNKNFGKVADEDFSLFLAKAYAEGLITSAQVENPDEITFKLYRKVNKKSTRYNFWCGVFCSAVAVSLIVVLILHFV